MMRPASTIRVFIGGTNKNKGNDVQITRKTSQFSTCHHLWCGHDIF